MTEVPTPPDRTLAQPHLGPHFRLSSVWIVGGIIVFALVLRLGALAIIDLNPDITVYAESNLTAKNLVEGKGYTYDFFGLRTEKPLRSFMPPLYVGLVYVSLRWAANPMLALGVSQAVLSAVICGAIYIIALTLSGKPRAAILAALAVALYPVLIVMVTVWHSLILHAAVLIWAMAVTLLLPTRHSWGWPTLAGLLWGLLVLGRPAFLAFMPLVVLWLWLNRSDPRTWLKSSVVLAVAVILVVLPWTVRNYLIHGEIIAIATNGGSAFWNGNNPFTTGSGQEVYTAKVAAFLGQPSDPRQPPIVQMQPYPLPPDLQAEVATISEVELDHRQFQAGLAFVRQQPREWLRLLGEKAVGLLWFRRNIGVSYQASWTPYYKVMYALLLIPLCAGLVISTTHWRRYLLVYLLFAFYVFVNLAYSVHTRYRWEVEPLFLVFAALAVSRAAERLSSARRVGRGSSFRSAP